MQSPRFRNFAALVSFFLALNLPADNGEAHLKKYADGIPGDKTIEAASKLNVAVPVMCREWHVWWGAPYGSAPHMSGWQHWNGEKNFGKYEPATTIERTRPDSSWRRWLNCTGYPLLGPYDSAQPDIIRWQLETAKRAGIECMHVHLWPSLWDDGADFTPIEIFETILETAAAMNYPVAVHDEIMFRRAPITKAQNLNSSVRRASMLLKRYGKHPGWYKTDGMPVYYFQNWTKWMKTEDLPKYLESVENEAGPVYWMVEQGPDANVFKIPQIKAVLGSNNSWFLHTAPFGVGPHPWEKLQESLQKGADLARANGKKFGVLVYTRFNDNHDRSTPGRGYISAEDGMFFVKSLQSAMQTKPDFLILTQWNDFEESAFIEPAWDYDGNNGDPYRYCRIVASSMNKKFSPAPLPERTQLDPYIRVKLFCDSKPGDMGPVLQNPELEGDKLTVNECDGPKVESIRFIQQNLAVWEPSMIEYKKEKLRLANYSVLDPADKGPDEYRFYAPGVKAPANGRIWLGIEVSGDDRHKVSIQYRSSDENYRIDSRWETRRANLAGGFIYDAGEKTSLYWTPLYDAAFNGREGDLTLRIKDPKHDIKIKRLILWSPEMKEESSAPGKAIKIPQSIDSKAPFVAVPYDKAGNAGLPMLIYGGNLKTAEPPPVEKKK